MATLTCDVRAGVAVAHGAARRMGDVASLRRSAPYRLPALMVTGEPELDRVVPVDLTRQYLDDLHSATTS